MKNKNLNAHANNRSVWQPKLAWFVEVILQYMSDITSFFWRMLFFGPFASSENRSAKVLEWKVHPESCVCFGDL